MAKNDSVGKTLVVAFSLCVVCSVLVSSAAVLLRPKQEVNQALDIKKNLLLAAGLLESPDANKEEIRDAYSIVETKVINLETGEVADINPEEFNMRMAEKDPSLSKRIDPTEDKAGIKRRAKYAQVYLAKENEEVKLIILPIHGKGLWSTMYGFLALAPDTRTVKGIGFYSHGETPGLGGEIDNPKWKQGWIDKYALDKDYEPAINVIKGTVDPESAMSIYQIDGLAGATITSAGVQGTVNYWLGDDGFGPYLENFRQKHDTSSTEEETI